MIKFLLHLNPFVLAIAVLQFFAVWFYWAKSCDYKLAILMLLYGLSNIVILFMRG